MTKTRNNKNISGNRQQLLIGWAEVVQGAIGMVLLGFLINDFTARVDAPALLYLSFLFPLAYIIVGGLVIFQFRHGLLFSLILQGLAIFDFRFNDSFEFFWEPGFELSYSIKTSDYAFGIDFLALVLFLWILGLMWQQRK